MRRQNMVEQEIKVQPDSLLVSGDKVFYTLQGEGQSIGKPAIFLRLHMCNLACGWCDTKYTWDKNDPRYFSEPERWSIDRVIEEISKYPCKRLIVTGGEPLLHKQALDILFEKIPDWDIEIETNGTLKPTDKMIERGVQFNTSPKLANSGNNQIARYRPDVLKMFNKISTATFKFVVMSESDIKEIEGIISNCGLDVDKIILMPEGTSQDAISEHGQAVAELCKEKGYRLVPRLQIMLWGNKRAI